MKTFIVSLLFVVTTLGATSHVIAAGNGVALDEANIDLGDREAIKRGAKMFVTYCLNCHSASFMRYQRIAEDLDITEDEVTAELITTGSKIGDTMEIAMDSDDAKRWFGAAPPDLSVISRARGDDWLYTYMRSFYRDESRPWGVNNTVFPDVGMPHVLAELQGLQQPKFKTVQDSHGNESEVIVGFEIIKPGSMTKSEYDQTIHDLVAFLDYLAEPYKQTRKNVGTGVIIFLFVFLILAYMLKKEYWKDVH